MGYRFGGTEEEQPDAHTGGKHHGHPAHGGKLRPVFVATQLNPAEPGQGQHKAGDQFYFDGSGNLITKLSPKRICISALTAMAPLISSANELFYAGVDSNELRFNRTACNDVGLQCGGWGNVAFEIKVEKRKDAK